MRNNKRDIPLEVIEQGLKDSDWRVRAAAMNACQVNNIPIPVIRTIEPPELVYKKCVGGIIVVASIPKDAQIRGSFNHKCRASKAVIKEIIGDLCGEQVGISRYDLRLSIMQAMKLKLTTSISAMRSAPQASTSFVQEKKPRNIKFACHLFALAVSGL